MKYLVKFPIVMGIDDPMSDVIDPSHDYYDQVCEEFFIPKGSKISAVPPTERVMEISFEVSSEKEWSSMLPESPHLVVLPETPEAHGSVIVPFDAQISTMDYDWPVGSVARLKNIPDSIFFRGADGWRAINAMSQMDDPNRFSDDELVENFESFGLTILLSDGTSEAF